MSVCLPVCVCVRVCVPVKCAGRRQCVVVRQVYGFTGPQVERSCDHTQLPSHINMHAHSRTRTHAHNTGKLVLELFFLFFCDEFIYPAHNG